MADFLIMTGVEDLFVYHASVEIVQTTRILLQIYGSFSLKWKKHPNYKNKEEEVGLYKILEELPFKKIEALYISQKQGPNFLLMKQRNGA